MIKGNREIQTAPYGTMRVVWLFDGHYGKMQYLVHRNRREEWKTVRTFNDYAQMYTCYHKEVTNEVCPSIKAVRSIFNRTGIRSGKIPITTYDRLDYFSVDLISSTQVFDLKGRMNGVYACFSNVKDCVSRFQQYDDGSLSDIAELVNHWDEYYAPCIEKSVNRIVTAKMAEQMDKADKKLHEAIELKGVVQA